MTTCVVRGSPAAVLANPPGSARRAANTSRRALPTSSLTNAEKPAKSPPAPSTPSQPTPPPRVFAFSRAPAVVFVFVFAKSVAVSQVRAPASFVFFPHSPRAFDARAAASARRYGFDSPPAPPPPTRTPARPSGWWWKSSSAERDGDGAPPRSRDAGSGSPAPDDGVSGGGRRLRLAPSVCCVGGSFSRARRFPRCTAVGRRAGEASAVVALRVAASRGSTQLCPPSRGRRRRRRRRRRRGGLAAASPERRLGVEDVRARVLGVARRALLRGHVGDRGFGVRRGFLLARSR